MNELVPSPGAGVPALTISGKALPPHVPAWLLELHSLIAGGSADEAEAADRVTRVAPNIADRFPPEAFNKRSLEHVAATLRFWPRYAELVDALGGWWKVNKPVPPPPALLAAPPEPPPMTPEERAEMSGKLANLAAEMRARWSVDHEPGLFRSAPRRARPERPVQLSPEALARRRDAQRQREEGDGT